MNNLRYELYIFCLHNKFKSDRANETGHGQDYQRDLSFRNSLTWNGHWVKVVHPSESQIHRVEPVEIHAND